MILNAPLLMQFPSTNSHFKIKHPIRSYKIQVRSFYKSPFKFTSLTTLKPYLHSECRLILSGWFCSAVSVYSLSKMAENLSSLLSCSDLFLLRKHGLVLGTLVFTRITANYFQQAFLWEASLNCVYNIRVNAFKGVMSRDLGFFEAETATLPGDLANRITAEAADISDTIYSLLNTIVPCFLQLFAMGNQMLKISPLFSLITAVVIPSMAILTGCLGEKLHTISNTAQLSAAALSAYLNEVFPSILFLKANNAESCECIKFQLLAQADLSAYLKKKQMKVLIPQIIQLMFSAVLFIFGASSLAVSRGSFNCSAVISFITSLILLIEPIQGVGKAYNELKQGEPAIERLFNLISYKSQVIEKPDAVGLPTVTGEVGFCDLSFSYGDGLPPVLNDLNVYIKAGETVAFVGPSGGGKTTLVKLLLRLYEPLSGHISIDGYNIQNIQLESLRRHIGLVSQDTVLFSGTIAMNIGYRDIVTGIDMDRVELAARTANADEFIRSLPNQYQTNVGPRGSNFSGGQRQRLAIARALYQNPSILILDEATSALDTRSEFLVRQALHRLMQDRTVLVIAHRLETVLMAEKIFLLKDGKVQQLSHSSLLDGQHGSFVI